MKFTLQQIEHFRAYKKVQKSNRYNMMEPAAVTATGLTDDEHLFVIENYAALRKAAQRIDSHVSEKK